MKSAADDATNIRTSSRARGSSLSKARSANRSTNREIENFLLSYKGNLTEAKSIAALFRQQVATGGEIFERCEICHARATELARSSLVMRAVRLEGQYSGAQIREFLVGHGRLDPEEVDFFYDLLFEVTQEIAKSRSSP
ncbi:MAG: hypothetical protein GY789_17295 [Hyphomicrobiales bacterium]|nr:hypothetical protein [Hyphomicrobiales bacterium]